MTLTSIDEGYEEENIEMWEFMDMEENNRTGQFQLWFECDVCQSVLEFPLQMHWCMMGLSTQLRHTSHVGYLSECNKCFCLLESPQDLHRCPEESRGVSAADADWLECPLCHAILDYASQLHECPERDEGYSDDLNNST